MTVETGDILLELDSGSHLLIGEPCEVEDDGGSVWDAFQLYVIDDDRWTWYYACFLEDEHLYRKVA